MSMVINRPTTSGITEWQEYFDKHLREIGLRAPAPILDDTDEKYCRRVVRELKYKLPEDHELREPKIDKSMPNDALYAYIPQYVDAYKAWEKNPMRVPFGELKEIVTVDPSTGYKETTFIGRDNFVRFMSRPGRFGRIWNENTKEWRGAIPD